MHAYDVEDEQQAGVDLVEELERKYPLPGQVIVYRGTKDRTVEMARAVGAVCYHRAVGSIEENKTLSGSGRAGRDGEVSKAIIMRPYRGTQRAALQDCELCGGWDTGLPTLPLTQVDVATNVFAHPPRNSNDLQASR